MTLNHVDRSSPVVTGQSIAAGPVQSRAGVATHPRLGLAWPALTALSILILLLVQAMPLRAADRGRIEAFITVTGYDVVIESLQLGAASASGMAGEDTAAFSKLYAELARDVFQPQALRARALDFLEQQLTDDQLYAGAELYASELGQRIVAAENGSHVVDYAVRQAEGKALAEALRAANPVRLSTLSGMMRSVGNEDMSLAGLVELQVRFILAAQSAGAGPQSMPEPELRAQLLHLARERLPQMRRDALVSAAYTYRDISDEDLTAYADALARPEVMALYYVLNRVQYQVMIEFYEKLGLRLAEIVPERDL